MNKIALLLMLMTGCCHTRYNPTEACGDPRPHTGYMVVNNTGALLNIAQDGVIIAKALQPGQIMPIKPVWMRTSCIVATGFTPDGRYVGSDSYIFASNVRETWTVSRLIRPDDQPQ